MSCPLCLKNSQKPYFEGNKRQYLQCDNCHLVFVPKRFHLDSKEEKAEYDKHQNDPSDLGYLKFLSRTTEPLFARLSAGAIGLDFGCGPGPAISQLGDKQGITVRNYDLYYFPDPQLLDTSYDFITMTEVIEHLADPAKVLNVLDKSLKKKGILAIMTKRVIDRNAFASWHYKNDPTHIAFYSEATLRWIAKKMHWKLEVIDKDVVFFTKE